MKEDDKITTDIIDKIEDLRRKVKELPTPETKSASGDFTPELFMDLIDRSGEAIFIIDPESGGILYANERATSSLGYTSDEVSRLTVMDFDIVFGDLAAWKKHISNLRRTDAIVIESGHRRKDGTVFSVEVNSKLVLVCEREYVVSVARDIKKRKRSEESLKKRKEELKKLVEKKTAELTKANERLKLEVASHRMSQDALRKSEERYRSLFEESKDVVFIRDSGGRFLDINPAGVELFGYSTREEMLELNIARDIYFNGSDTKRFEEEIDRVGFVRDFEAVMKKKSGEKITVNITGNAVRNESGNVEAYRVILRDITRHKELEEQLIQAQKMEAVGQLTGGIAHDFNNILMALMMYTETMMMKTGGEDPLRVNIEQIRKVTERAAALTKRLLAFSRKQIMCLAPTDLNDTVRSVEKFLKRLIGEDIEFITKLTEDTLTVMADITQIELVLMNLATNARDAMPDGGSLLISTEAIEPDRNFTRACGYGRPGDYACINVIDTGSGMSEETKKKIFDPFFTTKEVGKGTGLGLSVVYGIVKQHNGHISVSSEPGGGTAFKIYLPVIAGASAKKTARTWTRKPFGTETILVAEDDRDVRHITRIVLERCGYRVIEATNGKDAVRKFKKNRDSVDVLIMDVVMPKMNGKEAYDEIKKISPEVKAIFLSGYTEDVIDRTGVLERGLHFISKPVIPSELLKTLRDVLSEDKGSREDDNPGLMASGADTLGA